MSQPTINTTPLFRTSLRSWQANWKARQAQTETDSAASEPVARPHRFARRKRRPQQSAPRSE